MRMYDNLTSVFSAFVREIKYNNIKIQEREGVMDEKFIGERITTLRLKKNVSEYRMSLELGQSKSYIQGITSGKAMPSMKQFLSICDYFGITPAEFFDAEADDPETIHKVTALVKQLPQEDIQRIIDLMERIAELNK